MGGRRQPAGGRIEKRRGRTARAPASRRLTGQTNQSNKINKLDAKGQIRHFWYLATKLKKEIKSIKEAKCQGNQCANDVDGKYLLKIHIIIDVKGISVSIMVNLRSNL